MIEARGLTKRYGATTAVDGLSFDVRPGAVTGFLGPNGAGKSTTMRMVLGLDRPDRGTATIGGKPYAELGARCRRWARCSTPSALHPSRSARDHLRWLAAAATAPGSRGSTRCSTWSASPTSPEAGRRVLARHVPAARHRRRAARRPEVLMFDEPVNGLDPEGILWIRGLMKSLAAEGRTVFVSSHLHVARWRSPPTT